MIWLSLPNLAIIVTLILVLVLGEKIGEKHD